MMKTNFYVQYGGQEYDMNYVVKQVKEIWANSGHKIKEIQTMNIYFKPEELMFYYVINDTESGSISM